MEKHETDLADDRGRENCRHGCNSCGSESLPHVCAGPSGQMPQGVSTKRQFRAETPAEGGSLSHARW